MNNYWNKYIYKIWSPFYDKFFNSGIFRKARKQVFQTIRFKQGQKVLFVGVGTGADLELIMNLEIDITAIDFSPHMLNKAKQKFVNKPITFIEMDAQYMTFEKEQFDYVIASLVLSVVPDPNLCLQEMNRVLKKEGQIVVFDKFASPNKRLSFPRKIIASIIKLFGTDISLVFEHVFQSHAEVLKVEEDLPIMLNGMYRKILLCKRI